MPELPEVETVRKTLETLVLGKEIEEVEVRWPKMVKQPVETALFIDSLKGEKIDSVSRRGKFLIFYTPHYALVSHLRMEGKYMLSKHGEESDKHVHAIFAFTDGSELRYRDVRKFGTFHLFGKGTEFKHPPLSGLGPEPFSEAFTPELLEERLGKTNRKIKAALLDQKLVVGLGNIYVDEALFRAGIHPERLASSITVVETYRLHKEIVATLKEAVDKGGSTIRTYINSQGKMGLFQLELNVYGRKDKPCKNCGGPIRKSVVGGRGTHYCPSCQPAG
ncbi:DNA-formamidopyrimidine glycosylase [Bacillus massilinigeriensis]|uniref:DNA-formamidopyrimidine glycosylase n=1 Tax=Bacillus mediterraneensis TaxID=1805474 RepID=UPI0008F87102|nr:DNA-formamidopyrimidine glycosylase [Bacillus mediterraneensis]